MADASPELTLEPVVSKLEKFILYETYSYIYIVGCDKRQTEYRVIKLDRQVEKPSRLDTILFEDDCVYTRTELKEMLEMIHEGNKTQGGLQRINTGFGILGFVRFLDCYYLILITQRRKVGTMSGNTIYGVKATEMIPIKPMQEGGVNQSWGKQVMGAVNKRLNPTQHEIAEQRYLGLFQFIDLTKDFYFSYTYDLTHSLQRNITSSSARVFPPPPCKDMYAWNYYLTSEIETCVGKLNACYWVLPMIHGSFTQRRCSLFGRILDITLIARRSRHFAGTRYLKRGVSDCGKVANEVEMEQAVHVFGVGEGLFSSILQVRGSIPTYWTQETSVTMPKPPIVLNRIDPTYAATQLHFADLMKRYSSPILVLDLTKHKEKREREMIVSGEYRTAIECLNSYMDEGQPKIQYCALDFSELSKQRNMNVLTSLKEVAAWATAQTSFYCSSPLNEVDPITGRVTPLVDSVTNHLRSSIDSNNTHTNSTSGGSVQDDENGTVTITVPKLAKTIDVKAVSTVNDDDQDDDDKKNEEKDVKKKKKASLHHHRIGRGFASMHQHGVLRTNCIDCLDRTNVAQFCVGVHALGLQLTTMGVITNPILENDSAVVVLLMDIYSSVGDQIALQYGGSEAHKKVREGAGVAASAAGGTMPGTATGGGKEFLTSIRRYYSNAFTDRLKQDAMNVFLGHYVVSDHDVALWDLDNDYYLHNFKVQTGVELTMSKYRQSWETKAEEMDSKEDDEDNDDDNEEDFFLSQRNSNHGHPTPITSSSSSLSSNQVQNQQSTNHQNHLSNKKQEQLKLVLNNVNEVTSNEAEVEANIIKSRNHVAAVAEQSLIVKQLITSPVPILKPEGTRSRRGDLRHSLPNMMDIVVAKKQQKSNDGKEGGGGGGESNKDDVGDDDESIEYDHSEYGHVNSLIEDERGEGNDDFRREEEYEFEEEDDALVKDAEHQRALEEKLLWKEEKRRKAQQKVKDRQQARMKRRCRLQREYSQLWWKQALKKYEEQFQPKTSSNEDSETMAPDTIGRFERVYRPEKLTQFDKKFAYEFSVPIPLQANQEVAQPRRTTGGFGSMGSKKAVNNPHEDVAEVETSVDVSTSSSFTSTASSTATSISSMPRHPSQNTVGSSFSEYSMGPSQSQASRSVDGYDKMRSLGPSDTSSNSLFNREVNMLGTNAIPVTSSSSSSSSLNAPPRFQQGPVPTLGEWPEEDEEDEEGYDALGVNDDEEGPDKVVTIGRLVRELFPMPRRGGGGSHQTTPGSSFDTAPKSHHVNRQGEEKHAHMHHEKKGEVEVVSDYNGRYGVSMKTAFIGDDSNASLSEAQRKDQARFSQFSEFASSPLKYFSGSLHQDAKDEMEVANWEVDLASTDVAGCRAITDLAHTAKTIKIGPYRGLDRNISAKEAFAVVQNELQRLTKAGGSHIQLLNVKQQLEEESEMNELTNLLNKSVSLTPIETTRVQYLMTKYNSKMLANRMKSVNSGTSSTISSMDVGNGELSNKEGDDDNSQSFQNKKTENSTIDITKLEPTEAVEVNTPPPPPVSSSSTASRPTSTRRRGSAGPVALAAAAAAALGVRGSKSSSFTESRKEDDGDNNENNNKAGGSENEKMGSFVLVDKDGEEKQQEGGLKSQISSKDIEVDIVQESIQNLITQNFAQDGIFEQISCGLRAACDSAEAYAAVIDPDRLSTVRSPLSDNATIDQYASYFQNDALSMDQTLDFLVRVHIPNANDDTTEAYEKHFPSKVPRDEFSPPPLLPAELEAAFKNNASSSSSAPLELTPSMADHVAYSTAVRKVESQVARDKAMQVASIIRASLIQERDTIAEPDSPGANIPYVPLNPPLPPPRHVVIAQEEEKKRKEKLLKLLEASETCNATPTAHAQLLQLQQPISSSSSSRSNSTPTASSILNPARKGLRRASAFLPKSPAMARRRGSTNSVDGPRKTPPPMSVYKAQDASDLSDNYIKQQKMINALGGHFQDPVAEKRYAEENVGPVFGMSNTPNTDGSSDMVAMTHNPLMNPSMNNDSSFSSSSSSSSSSSFSSSTSSSSIGGRRGQGSFVTRVGGSSVNHLDNHTSNSNIGSQVMNQQSSSSRMYYGFDPTISMSDKTGDNDDQEEREPSNLSMNPSFISNVSMYQPRTSSAGSRRSSDLMRGSMNNSMISSSSSSSSSNINVSGSSKKQLSQGQGGFFTNEENPFVLFNKPAAESPRPILEKNIQ